MNRLTQRIADMKLRSKLLLSYLAANLLVVALGISGLWTIAESSQEKAYNNISHNFNEALLLFSNRINANYTVADNLLADYFITRLETDYKSVADYYTSYFDLIRDTVLTQNQLLESGLRVNIYVDNPTIIYERSILKTLTGDITGSPWYYSVSEGNGAVVMYGPIIDSAGNSSVVVGRMLSGRSQSYAAVMQIQITNEIFSNLCKTANLSDDAYLLKHDGTVLFANDEDAVGRSFYELYPTTRGWEDSSSSLINLEGRTLWINSLSANRNTSSIILANVKWDEPINNEVFKYVIWPCVIFAGSMLLNVCLIIMFFDSICKKIFTLTNAVSELENGNYEILVPVGGKDELGRLCEGFNQMAGQINNLVNTQYVYEKRLHHFEYKKKEAELLSLQSQIDPHFLVNFLEAVRVRLIKDGNTAVGDILLKFTKFFRRGIDWSIDRVSVEQELIAVREYLDMQIFRYRKKISCDCRFDEAIKDVLIPKFIIQPLVENSIKHGLEIISENGFISVEARQTENGQIFVSVEDNGRGIEHEQLETLRGQLASDDLVNNGTNVGLLNVSHRIRLVYGDEYIINIESEPGRGTRVSFTLPSAMPDRPII